jgi:hypothetical protein
MEAKAVELTEKKDTSTTNKNKQNPKHPHPQNKTNS